MSFIPPTPAQPGAQRRLSFYVGGNSNGRGAGERIAVDPNDSNIVFLGTNANGLWESTNAGHSFSQVTSFSTSGEHQLSFFSIPTAEPPATPRQDDLRRRKLHGLRHQSLRNHQRRHILDGNHWHRLSPNRMDARIVPPWLPMAISILAYANAQTPTEPHQRRRLPLQHLHRRLGQYLTRRAPNASGTLRSVRL